MGDWTYGAVFGLLGGGFWCVVAPFATPLSFGEVALVGLGFALFTGVSTALKRKARRGAKDLGVRARERRLARADVRESRRR